MWPLQLNTCLDGTLVAQTQRYFLASFTKLGDFECSTFHQSNGESSVPSLGWGQYCEISCAIICCFVSWYLDLRISQTIRQDTTKSCGFLCRGFLVFITVQISLVEFVAEYEDTTARKTAHCLSSIVLSDSEENLPKQRRRLRSFHTYSPYYSRIQPRHCQALADSSICLWLSEFS